MKILKIMIVIMVVMGVSMLAIACMLVVRTRSFVGTAETVPGTVVANVWEADSDGGGTYHPRVRYRDRSGETHEFLSNTGSNPAAFDVNEEVQIGYDPRKPANGRILGFWSLYLGAVICAGLGVIFTSIGILPIWWNRRRQEKLAWLRAHGQRIQADITGVKLNGSVEVNGSSPYRIHCQWHNPATNQVHVFKSENIWFDPTNYIPGKQLEVLIDPSNARRYALDTAFLPSKAK